MISYKRIFLYIGFLVSFNLSHSMDIETGNIALFEKMKETLVFFRHFPTRFPHVWERRKYEHNGVLIPIVHHPRIIRAGYIMAHAQPSKWFGFSYEGDYEPEDLIFLEENVFDLNPTITYQARIIVKNSAPYYRLLSACLFFDGSPHTSTMKHTLAILWQAFQNVPPTEQHHVGSYITSACLEDIQKKDDIFDLDKDKVEITL